MKKFLIGFSVCVGVILSVILIRNVRIEIAKDALRDSNVGDYVVFGAYEQDREVLNGKEDIEWLVLEKEEGRILVLSKYALDAQQYHTSKEDVTWETSTLRQWLNEDFLNLAFSGLAGMVSSSRCWRTPRLVCSFLGDWAGFTICCALGACFFSCFETGTFCSVFLPLGA